MQQQPKRVVLVLPPHVRHKPDVVSRCILAVCKTEVACDHAALIPLSYNMPHSTNFPSAALPRLLSFNRVSSLQAAAVQASAEHPVIVVSMDMEVSVAAPVCAYITVLFKTPHSKAHWHADTTWQTMTADDDDAGTKPLLPPLGSRLMHVLV